MIEEAIGLFALPPREFVAERNRLAKLLKSGGRTDDSALVSSLKRPKLGGYALNRLAHEHGPIIERLVEAIDSAADAQTAAIGGDASSCARRRPNCGRRPSRRWTVPCCS